MPVATDIAVTFVIRHLARDWADLERLDEAAITREPNRFVGGRNSWIAQGYLRLREPLSARRISVHVADRTVPGSLCIVHRDDANGFAGEACRSFLVVIRADRAPVAACDFAIAQNGLNLASCERFVPLWPQPGIRPRRPERASRIRRIVYQGRTGSVPKWFLSRNFLSALASRGLLFEVRDRGWDDYRDADVVIAARQDARIVLESKPATKIYNAWHARVPMLASPEPAYRELRRSRLDFLEVADSGDALAALDRLRDSPALYQAMVANGAERAVEFSVEAIRARWLALFDREIIPAFEAGREALAHRRPWYLSAMLRQKAMSRMWRAGVAAQRWLLRSPWATGPLLEGLGRTIASGHAGGPLAGESTPRSAFL
jgi:hypothetical protein